VSDQLSEIHDVPVSTGTPTSGDAPAPDGVPGSYDVSARIQAILDDRRRSVPLLRAEIEWWLRVDDQLARLAGAVHELSGNPSTPAELRDGLAGFRVEEAREGVADAVRLLRVLESRFSRTTINIGVSGQARVGKSTLLQSISGLDDGQIPTGKGLPVTAVRSRIFHAPHHQRATLRLHTFDTFVADVLAPHHAQLGLPGLPTTVTEFAGWDYPSPGSARSGSAAGRSDPPSYATLLKRLRDMQTALPSYRADLVGGEREIGLDELRPHVAYPTNDELGASGAASRRYLAVRDLRIECTFPHAKVERLAVVDLPGLGEVAVGAEAHHIDGLQNEVDVVLLVKRAMGDEAYWGEADARTLDLLDIARGFVSKRDFVFLVLNQGGIDPIMQTTLRDNVNREINMGEPDRFFQVLETDAADAGDVFGRALTPVLQHLTARMPAMDAEVLAGTRAETLAAADRIELLVADLGLILGTVRTSTGSAAEDLDRRAKRLRQDLAAGLQELVARLHEQAREASEDPEFIEAVEQVYAANREWITGGLGVGEQTWREEGLRRIRVDGFSAGYTGEELNRIRAERMEQLWTAVADVLDGALGDLLADRSGHDALRELAELLERASPPCPRLRRAVQALLGIRLDYRSQLHPRVRSELDGLALEVLDPQTGSLTQQVTVPRSEAGVEQLYRFVVRTAEQAAYLTKKALLREAVTPALVLHAAAEQFEDTVIRSGDSEVEFRRLADSYKNEIWPGVYQEIDAANARFAAVTRARDALVASLVARPGRSE
jgi:hypothetical protein